MKKITAIILNYNSAKDTEKCLYYLSKQNYSNLEIIVVDNASTRIDEDKKLQELNKKYNITYLKNDINNGFSAGNNIGIRYSLNDNDNDNEPEWFLIINPDVELRDNYYIYNALNIISKYEKVVVAGTEICLPSGIQQNPLIEKKFFDELLIGQFFSKVFKKHSNVNKLKETGYCQKLIGCCFFIKADFLKEIGYLDEGTFLYCEESILASQVIKHGYNELFVSNIVANHEHYEKLKQGKRGKKMQTMIKSRIYWIKKYSNYNKIVKIFLVLSKRIQMFVWKFF